MKRAGGFTLLLLTLATQAAFSQGGRGNANPLDGLPNPTPAQRALLVHENQELTSQAAAVVAARNALAAVAFAEPRNPAAIPIMAGAVREAELAFAMAHVNALGRIQASGDRLSPEQITAWNRVVGPAPGGRGGRG